MWQSLKGNECIEPVKNAAGKVVDRVVTIDCIPILVGNIIFWLLLLAGVTALILIIISGFKFVTSGGDPKQAEGARKTLTYAVIGLVLVLISFGIVRVIGQITGVRENCINRFGFTQCVPEDISGACSPKNPDGFCSGGKTCVESYYGGGRPVISCRYLCEGDQKSGGWCPNGKNCKGNYNENLGKVVYKCK